MSQLLDKISLKKKWEKNYLAVSEPAGDKPGVKVRYVYIGPWYVYDGPYNKVRTKKIAVCLLSVISLIVFIAAFMTASELSRSKVIMVPAMAALCFHMLEISGALQLILSKEKMDEISFENIDRAFKTFNLFRTILMIVVSVLCLYHMLSGRAGQNDLFTAAGCIAAAAATLAANRIYAGMSYHTEKNEETLKRASEIARRAKIS